MEPDSWRKIKFTGGRKRKNGENTGVSAIWRGHSCVQSPEFHLHATKMPTSKCIVFAQGANAG
jgi:hypothetical protein